jgi:hypothetical protein
LSPDEAWDALQVAEAAASAAREAMRIENSPMNLAAMGVANGRRNRARRRYQTAVARMNASHFDPEADRIAELDELSEIDLNWRTG